MIEKTAFEEKDISDELNNRYGIIVDKIERINQGTANIFKIFSKKNIYVLKEFQSKYGEADVKNEIKAINHLRKSTQIPLPEYIKLKNGESCFEHKGKIVIMQKYIYGKTYNKNEGNYSELLESAYYLGKIIEGFNNYNTDNSILISDWYSEEEFEKAERKYNEILKLVGKTEIDNRIKKDLLFKKKLLVDIRKNINSDINNITHKVSHGDYSSLQFIYDDNNKIKAILDFIKVKRLPIVWEIARSYSYIDKEMMNGKINIDNLVDYTKMVTKNTKLNEYDLKYLPYVYLIQLARSTYGYEQYYKDVKNKDELLKFGFYRTNICRNLNNNAKEISRRLMEIKGE